MRFCEGCQGTVSGVTASVLFASIYDTYGRHPAEALHTHLQSLRLGIGTCNHSALQSELYAAYGVGRHSKDSKAAPCAGGSDRQAVSNWAPLVADSKLKMLATS